MIERIIVGEMYTNAYIYSIWKKECIIIDPGADAEKIISHLETKNLKPRGIVLTHGHFDHLLGIPDILQYYSSKKTKVKVAIHKDDANFLGRYAKKTHVAMLSRLGAGIDDFMEKYYKTLPEPDVLLKEGNMVFSSDLKVIHTPGHSPGSICLLSEEGSLLLSGDTLFAEGIGRTDIKGGDQEEILKSIKTKILNLPENIKIYPGHGPFSSIERERRSNPYLIV